MGRPGNGAEVVHVGLVSRGVRQLARLRRTRGHVLEQRAEAYAHQGPLKGGQGDKVVADAFKLLYLARQWPNAELVLLFSDDAAARTFRPPSKSWVAKAVTTLGVKIEVVPVPAAMRDELRRAQIRQSR